MNDCFYDIYQHGEIGPKYQLHLDRKHMIYDMHLMFDGYTRIKMSSNVWNKLMKCRVFSTDIMLDRINEHLEKR